MTTKRKTSLARLDREIRQFLRTGEGQKQMMAESVGMDSDAYALRQISRSESDYGADPLENGMFRMVPSGDVVDYEERMRRLPVKSLKARNW
jgi:hypothetical protein